MFQEAREEMHKKMSEESFNTEMPMNGNCMNAQNEADLAIYYQQLEQKIN